MSISIICRSLVALFVFVSIYACNARQLLSIKRDPGGSFYLLNQEIERLSSRVRVLDPSNAHNPISNEFDHKGQLNKHFLPQEKIKAHVGEHYPRKTLTEIQVHGNRVKSSSKNVSWKVPHEKKGKQQQQPGFNLDYSPPKTHPPVHN